MIRLRDARYCNLKLFLLYLVIYGHWIEPQIYDSESILYQYKIIYVFHMPLFAFLSGLFIHNSDDCVRQIKKILPIYMLLQVMMTISKAADDFFTPYWILWYLLSDCLWLCFGWMWFRIGNTRSGYACLGMLFLIGALAGYIPWLDRTFSGSRTIVFLPYFFAGLLCSPDVQWQKHRRMGVLALVGALCMVCLFIRHIPVTFYQFEGKSSVYTWLCQIGKNAWLKECRKRKLYECVSVEELVSVASEGPSPETLAIKNEEYKKIRRAILNLSEPYKNVFILHVYADIKLKDIAALYGKSESWARVTFYRAKKQVVQEAENEIIV